MSSLRKILTVCIVAPTMMLGSVSLFAQSKATHKKPVKKHLPLVTIGFQSGRELLFNSSPLIHSRQSKVHPAISSRLVLRKPINAHFKVETGLSYSAIQTPGSATVGYKKPYTLAVPVTLQYYFLPKQCRVQPYFGAGMQYNFNTPSNTISPFNGDITPSVNNYQSGTKYISILFTQGMTFEINTKIEINESFHFIPNNGNKTIGLDLGIGYNIP